MLGINDGLVDPVYIMDCGFIALMSRAAITPVIIFASNNGVKQAHRISAIWKASNQLIVARNREPIIMENRECQFLEKVNERGFLAMKQTEVIYKYMMSDFGGEYFFQSIFKVKVVHSILV
ncbi:MAG: hypothetical protein CXT73_04635 [Methanobacteriota archaeon]|nr:MAG: hypothetical protein CXT73_04635 [Euryarchaeota archaeon]